MAPGDQAKRTRPLIIYSGLGEPQNGRIAAHWSQPTIIATGTKPIWEVPDEAEVLMTFMRPWGKAPADKPASWPNNLRWAQIGSAGVDIFPSWFFTAPTVTCGRGIQAPAMSEYVIAAVLAHEKKFWDVRARSLDDWHSWALGGVAGKTLGLAGFGAIGTEVASRAASMGMKVKAIIRTPKAAIDHVEIAQDILELLATSDHLVLALPLTDKTRHIINAETLSVAKPGLHLINVARGGLIDDKAMLAALDSGKLSAATLDVTLPEPLPADHIFFKHPAIRLTPHISGMSEDFEDRLSAKLLDNLDRYMRGEPLTELVDRGRGY